MQIFTYFIIQGTFSMHLEGNWKMVVYSRSIGNTLQFCLKQLSPISRIHQAFKISLKELSKKIQVRVFKCQRASDSALKSLFKTQVTGPASVIQQVLFFSAQMMVIHLVQGLNFENCQFKKQSNDSWPHIRISGMLLFSIDVGIILVYQPHYNLWVILIQQE